MFTGLIEEVGVIAQVETTEAGSRLTVSATHILADLQLGDSIAIDGVCTTVVSKTPIGFSVEATPETLSKTTFKFFVPGSRINLERPLTPNSRIGGHYVTGHVDGTARIVTRTKQGNSWVFRFKVEDPALVPLLVEKGSVSVSGISLTVNTVIQDVFSVAIIPHTLTHTNLDDYGVEDIVNIETDLLGKYVQRLLQYGRLEEQALVPAATTIHSGNWFCHDPNVTGRP